MSHSDGVEGWRTLGATADARGTSFALWAPRAERVEVCLIDDPYDERRITLGEITHGVHHGHVAGARPGDRYGFRVHGPYDEGRGDWCDPAKLLLDPYARAIDGPLIYTDAVFADGPRGVDSGPYVPRSVIVGGDLDAYDWADDRAPRTDLSETVLYELHVRGFTMQHPGVPEELRGTYAGLAHPATVEHLVDLGVTAVELMPIHHFVSERLLAEAGQVNYWGYSSVGFFAPHGPYSASGTRGEQVREFRDLVRALHAAGLEVIMDVVYNHTGEGDLTGPTLSFRGIDNAAYYRLDPDGRYRDFTACGNTVDLRRPHVVRMVLDSMRYWVTEMHVDGFRVDLASALARGSDGVDMAGPFMIALGQDPVLRDVKLIAEPWDLGDGGYQLGRFPTLWTEWNDKFRETVRSFWLRPDGDGAGVRDLAYRLSGSSDLYRDDGRRPYASINYVASHDGRTLADLVSAASAPSHVARALLATTLLAPGVPMLLAGDETGRTQGGSDNAYRDDSPVSWLDWSWLEDESSSTRELRNFVRRLLDLRRAQPALRKRHFFDGRAQQVPVGGADVAHPDKDLTWLTEDGVEPTVADWYQADRRTIGAIYDGSALSSDGEPADDVLLWLNARSEAVAVRLPDDVRGRTWRLLLDTEELSRPDGAALPAGGELALAGRSLVVLARAGEGPAVR